MALKPDSIGSYQTAATLSNGLAMVSQATINSLALGAPVGATAASIAGAMAAAAAAAASNGLNNSPGHSPSHQDGSEGHQGGPSSTNGPQNGSGDRGGSPGQGAGQQATDPPPNKLFVGGLSWQTTTDKLRDYFSAFGTVTDVLIMKDPITQRSRGFGFITFQDAMSVDKVLQVTNHSLDGKKIDPKHATPRSAVKKASNEGGMNPNQAATSVAAAAANGTLKTKKIFVGGLSQETTVDEVKQYFTQFGPVEEAVLLMDNQTKRHRGFGFVTMASENAVDRICDIHFHVIKAKKVECKKALPREAVAAATAAAAAAAAAAQQPSLAYLIARQRLAAQAVAANGLVPAGFGGAGVHLGHTSPALLQLYEGLPSSQAAGQAMMQAAPQQGNPNGGNPVVSSAQMSAGVNSQATYGKVLAYQGASSAYRYAPYQLGNPAAAAAALAAAAAANQSQGGHQGMQGGQGPPGYQNYAIPTAVDMSAFQGLDWSAMAGLPAMYAA